MHNPYMQVRKDEQQRYVHKARADGLTVESGAENVRRIEDAPCKLGGVSQVRVGAVSEGGAALALICGVLVQVGPPEVSTCGQHKIQ